MTDGPQGQQLLRELLDQHRRQCPNRCCFAREGIHPEYFCITREHFEAECIPDSLQEGHGLRFSLPTRYSDRRHRDGERTILTSYYCGPASFKVRCLCAHPDPHPLLLDLLCELYNRS